MTRLSVRLCSRTPDAIEGRDRGRNLMARPRATLRAVPRWRRIAVGCVVAVLGLASIGVILRATGVLPNPFSHSRPSGSGLDYPDGALTPQERTIVATPRPDGTLRVDMSLIFDAGPGTSEPVWWSIGGTRIGWESSERRAQYWVNPTVTEVAAQELTPDGAKIPLSVVVDDTGYHDPFLDAHVFRLTGPSAWSAGRHAIKISYLLGDVFVSTGGTPVLVLPLAFADGPGTFRQSLNVTRVRIAGADTLRCLATNINAADQRTCASASAGSVAYNDNQVIDLSTEAVGLVSPAGLSVQPKPALERSR